VRFPDWIIEHGDALVFVIFFGAYLWFGVLERFVPRRTGDLRRRERWPANLGLTIANLIVLSVLPVSLVSASRWTETQQWGLFHQPSLPVGMVIAGTLLARAFISFGTHYLMHRVPLFWRLHRVHHLDTNLDTTTTVRFHPLEFLVTLVLAVPLVLLLGLEPWVLMLYEGLDAGVTLFSHANIRLPAALNAALRYVIVTPDLHRIHHSSWLPETNSNFGAVFPIWDLLFGTYRSSSRQPAEDMELGLEEPRGAVTNSLWWLLLSPFRGEAGGDPAPTSALRERRASA
jgi:sterol desaturase/sphingolipid hydroxylase (fatty acid hydroxylase superfamily)